MIITDEHDMNVLKPAYNVAKFFRLLPTYYDDRNQSSAKHKFYSVLEVFLVLSIYAYTLKLSMEEDPAMANKEVLFVLPYTISTLSLVFSILITAFWNYDTFKLFFNRFEIIDKYVNKRSSKTESNKKIRFYIEFVTIHIVFIFVTTYDAFTTIPLIGLSGYSKFFVKCCEHYLNAIMVLLMYNYCKFIRWGFMKFNNELEEIINSLDCSKHGCTKGQPVIKVYNNIDEITKTKGVYTHLTDLIALFNKVFGWQILFIMVVIVTAMLEMINEEIRDNFSIGIDVIIFIWMIVDGVRILELLLHI